MLAMSANGVIAIVMGAIALGGVAWVWFTRDRRAELELGAVDDVWFRVLRGPSYGVVRARLLVGPDTITTRCRGLPHVFARLMEMDFTLRASDFEVAVAPVSRRVRAVSRASVRSRRYPTEWDAALLICGADRRGRLELEFFRSRTAAREDVREALIRAGARSADELAPVQASG